MAKLLLEIGDVNACIQSPTTETMPQKMRCDSLSLPHFAQLRLLETCILRSFVQQSLDLPGRDMAMISALENISNCASLKMGIQGL
jgi:hypothetical protein